MTTLYQKLVAVIEADLWPDDVDECIEWEWSKDKDGYGGVWFGGKQRRVHRLAYCLSNGFQLDDIGGWMVLHSCRNTSCYRPDHIRLGNQYDNMRDEAEHGTNYSANVTICPQGHEYTTANTGIYPNGGRRCRACHRIKARERQAAWTPEQKAAKVSYDANRVASRTPEQKAARAVYIKEWRASRTDEQKAANNVARRAKHAKHKAAAS